VKLYEGRDHCVEREITKGCNAEGFEIKYQAGGKINPS
jgi:hypothetical protein